MKNIIKVLGFVALVVIIGFSFASCDEAEPGGNLGGNSGGKKVTKEFNEPGVTYDIIIGAADGISDGTNVTVEVFAIGGGGGGQGGHRKAYMQGLTGTRYESGRGAGGGGGATAYVKFEAVSPVMFRFVTVGDRGNAGAAFDEGVGGSWRAGSAGTAGGQTRVSYLDDEKGIDFLMDANGGGGGGGSNQNVTGGAGGTASLSIADLNVLLASGFAAGQKGADGRHNVQSTDDHGKGGGLGGFNEGSVTNFLNYGLGGDGGYGNATIGSMLGFSGCVIIVVTVSE